MTTLDTLLSFGTNQGSDTSGVQPTSNVIADAQGNLFGTTLAGGTNNTGTVYELVKGSGGAYTQMTIFAFDDDHGSGNVSGCYPNAGLISDAQGNLFGTTTSGGAHNYGTIFELIKGSGGTYSQTVLLSFDARGGPNATGSAPYAGLISDAQGNLFGTTNSGGTSDGGTVFKLVKGVGGGYTQNVLFNFAALDSSGNATGARPQAGLISDTQGNLFGTTRLGGTNNTGTVFELVKGVGGGYTQNVLFNFAALGSSGNATGASPYTGLAADAQGNMFGTTYRGGTNGTGTVFELVKSTGGGYTQTTLLSFDASGSSNTTGTNPLSGLTIDAQGNLFGTANTGGTNDSGTVYELVKGSSGSYTSTILASFAANPSGNATGAYPQGGLISDAQGNLYGTTTDGGTNDTGAVFRISGSGYQLPTSTSSSGGGSSSSTPSITPGNDVVSLGYGDNSVAGLTGDDVITAGTGNDLLLGNQGNDTIQAGDGQNTVFGGFDDDRITVGNGANLLYGNEGSDTIVAGGGDNTVFGGNAGLDPADGADAITVGGGNDLVLGNGGDDTIALGGGTDTVFGGQGNDAIAATGSGNDLLFGNEGSDTIRAGDGNNTLVGGSGNSAIDSLDGADVITSGAGNDLILGNGGDDTVASGSGSDTVLGGFGRDILLGNQGNDILLGNQGDDTLFGGQGSDTLFGGQGNDVLFGGEGDDVLYGNEGLNTFVFNPGDSDFKTGVSTGDTIMDFVTGTSRIDFAAGPAGSAANFGAAATTATDFASAQAVAESLISAGDAYAFVANGTDGYLFTTGGTGTTITDAVKLAGDGTVGSLKYQDIAHGALA